MPMPKPETVSRLCIKCHSKTVHEVQGKDGGWDKAGLHRLWVFAYRNYHVKLLLSDEALAENI